ncbi:MAG: tRNA (adenosine(37)-N6)-dimethylallyltransferase MiaA, partial [Ferruginibacter sp.]
VISADSRQCYQELNIGVAKPSLQQLNDIPHYFINTHHITETVTAADFEHYALGIAADLFAAHDVIVMAGGTGLYINAFAQGMDNIPAVPAFVRDNIKKEVKEGGFAWLKAALEAEDSNYSQKGDMHNPQRMMRALEVIRQTGTSILDFQKGQKKNRDFNIIYLGIETERQELYQRIEHRVDEMILQGLVAEVNALRPYSELNAMKTVGYTEILDYLSGKITLPEAIKLVKQHTRNYAKRQVTWFKKNPNVSWMALEDIFSYATQYAIKK